MLMVFKKFFCSISNWFYRHFGADRLSTLPRKIQSDSRIKNSLSDFKKSYYFYRHTNIAISGREASGKKSFVETFEKTRWFPVGKFVHIDVRHFMGECGHIKETQSLQAALDTYIENCIISRAKAGQLPGLNDRLIRGSDRIYKKPLIAIMVALITGGVLGTMGQWSAWLENLLPISWNKYAVLLVIMSCCWITIALCGLCFINTLVAFWPVKWINRFRATILKGTEVEVSTGNTVNGNNYNQTTIYIMCRLKWQIGHTVVFDNLELLGEEAFQKIIPHLCGLNSRVNSHGGAWKLWDIYPFRIPIRFLYIYRNDLVQLKRDMHYFDKEFYILPNVTVDNVFYELKTTFETEVSKGITKLPLNQLFPLDANYMANIAPYLVNKRYLNEIVQNYIAQYEDFVSRAETEPSKNDLHKLFSFVVYGLFFPKDRAKFASQTSVVFSEKTDKQDIAPQYINLFEYLTSTTCPEVYRIDFLCMRFVDFRPNLYDEHIRNYEEAYGKGDVKTALKYIEKARCCYPENVELHNQWEALRKIENNLSKME